MADGEEGEGTGRAIPAPASSSVRDRANGSKGQSRWDGGQTSAASRLGGTVFTPSTSLLASEGNPVPIDAESAKALLSVIDREILPALEYAMPEMEREAIADLADEDADALLTLLLKQDYAETVDFLETLRQRPVPLMVLFTDLMGPVARRLGQMWKDDECSFVEVTVGVSHLQRLVRDLSPLYQSNIPKSSIGGRILLAAVSGEQHTFGLSLLSEVFRRAGWTVTEAPRHSREELRTLLQTQNYDLYGFSLSCVDLVESLKADIDLVRSTESGTARKVIVGGPAFSENPDIVDDLSADGYAHDASGALALADGLIGDMKGAKS